MLTGHHCNGKLNRCSEDLYVTSMRSKIKFSPKQTLHAGHEIKIAKMNFHYFGDETFQSWRRFGCMVSNIYYILDMWSEWRVKLQFICHTHGFPNSSGGDSYQVGIGNAELHLGSTYVVVSRREMTYRKIYNIRRIKSQNWNDYCLVLHWFLPNLLKTGVK